MEIPLPAVPGDFLLHQTRLILSSYRRWFGKNLLPGNDAEDVCVPALFYAPFIVASTGTENDPVLNYGNRKALELWEMAWEIFTKTPGRRTAEPVERETRSRFLEQVRLKGFIENYSGVRISSSGRRFEIRQAKVWNLLDEKGLYSGQAVTFSDIRGL